MPSGPTPAPGSRPEYAPGDVVAACYKLIELIGEGGTGTVWSAEHVPTGDTVAIKLLRKELAKTEAAGRFEREARLAGQLMSPYIVRVEDHGVGENGRPFVVMELLEGELLSARLKRESRLSLAATLPIVQHLAEALELAHRQKIVHRDLKPENVFLEKVPGSAAIRIKLMDFGIAREFDVAEEPAPESNAPPSKVALQRQLTRVGDVVGTPAYMSPEQATAKPLDQRSDLWALGATVYRLLTGEVPFGNGPQATVAYRIMTSTPAPPSTMARGLPRSIDAWMAKALAKDPKERFESARTMAEELSQVAMASVTSVAPPPAPPAPPAPAAEAGPVAQPAPTRPDDGGDVALPQSSLRTPILVAVGIVVLLIVLRLACG